MPVWYWRYLVMRSNQKCSSSTSSNNVNLEALILNRVMMLSSDGMVTELIPFLIIYWCIDDTIDDDRQTMRYSILMMTFHSILCDYYCWCVRHWPIVNISMMLMMIIHYWWWRRIDDIDDIN